MRRGIRFEAVDFTYPGASSKALSSFILDVPAGEIAVIVGPNGAGKSTLIKLLYRFYEPDRGGVCVDGANIRDRSPREIRQLVLVLFQDPVRYAMTVAENVAPDVSAPSIDHDHQPLALSHPWRRQQSRRRRRGNRPPPAARRRHAARQVGSDPARSSSPSAGATRRPGRVKRASRAHRSSSKRSTESSSTPFGARGSPFDEAHDARSTLCASWRVRPPLTEECVLTLRPAVRRASSTSGLCYPRSPIRPARRKGGMRPSTRFHIAYTSHWSPAAMACSLLDYREDDGIMAEANRKRGFVVEFQPMSPEDMQRTMQFVVNQQAQFSVDLAKLETNLASFANHVAASEARWTERFEQITGGLIGLTAIAGQIASAQLRTDEQLRELRGGLSETDAHLNVVIEMFERHLREDHGRPPS